MSRGAHTFKQGDVARALKAIVQAITANEAD
jgi:hypothetical protein